MVIFNDDFLNGRITINTNYKDNRVNGIKTADWNENMSTCSLDDPGYDPTFFDNFCANFYWCWRDYNYDCSPNYAIGITRV